MIAHCVNTLNGEFCHALCVYVWVCVCVCVCVCECECVYVWGVCVARYFNFSLVSRFFTLMVCVTSLEFIWESIPLHCIEDTGLVFIQTSWASHMGPDNSAHSHWGAYTTVYTVGIVYTSLHPLHMMFMNISLADDQYR